MQAVHELRHKRHALRLYAQVYHTLAVPGQFMICDHAPLDDSSRSSELYMTEPEQLDALEEAGSANVRIELRIDSLVLYAGERRNVRLVGCRGKLVVEDRTALFVAHEEIGERAADIEADAETPGRGHFVGLGFDI